MTMARKPTRDEAHWYPSRWYICVVKRGAANPNLRLKQETKKGQRGLITLPDAPLTYMFLEKDCAARAELAKIRYESAR